MGTQESATMTDDAENAIYLSVIIKSPLEEKSAVR